jgi:hypothetical protein
MLKKQQVMSNGFIYVVDANFIDKIEENKYPGPKCLCIVGLMVIFILSQLYVSISTLPWQLRIFSYLRKFSCFMALGPGFKNITKLM